MLRAGFENVDLEVRRTVSHYATPHSLLIRRVDRAAVRPGARNEGVGEFRIVGAIVYCAGETIEVGQFSPKSRSDKAPIGSGHVGLAARRDYCDGPVSILDF